MTTATADQLNRLYQLILQERECAKKLDMDGLQALSAEKGQLVALLSPATELADELKGLARTIQKENRRNAYLIWSALGWIREHMAFFNQQVSQPSYGAGGTAVRNGQGGRLLSGKV